jgi:hypothetical protein
VVTAARLTPERRRPEEEFWQEFQDSEPLILGMLFDAMAYGLATYRDTAAPAVRMADAARMMAAAGKALGWEHSSIATLLSSNRLQAIESVVDANPFALALLALLGEQPQWRGSTSELLKILTDKTDERTSRARAWPTSPVAHVPRSTGSRTPSKPMASPLSEGVKDRATRSDSSSSCRLLIGISACATSRLRKPQSM